MWQCCIPIRRLFHRASLSRSSASGDRRLRSERWKGHEALNVSFLSRFALAYEIAGRFARMSICQSVLSSPGLKSICPMCIFPFFKPETRNKTGTTHMKSKHNLSNFDKHFHGVVECFVFENRLKSRRNDLGQIDIWAKLPQPLKRKPARRLSCSEWETLPAKRSLVRGESVTWRLRDASSETLSSRWRERQASE